jgi:quercetin dioxygenase-like cupin family protein
MILRTLILTLFAIGFAAPVVHAQKPPIITPDKLTWADDDEPGSPPGLKVAVLYGDPSKPEPYVLRVKFPANSRFPLHTHPNAEHVTVLKGTFGTTFGSADRSKGQLLPAGSFVSIPANTAHFVWVGHSETIIQIHGIGPDETKIVK